METGQIYNVRFFFDHGAGGCLWADDAPTRQAFGLGPVDYAIATALNRPDKATLQLIDQLDSWHANFLSTNQDSASAAGQPTDYTSFNKMTDALLEILQQQLGDVFLITDTQERYMENKDLEEHLKATKDLEDSTPAR